MSDQIPPWAIKYCDRCGCDYQFTRSEPKPAPDEYVCHECAAYERGCNDTRAEQESRTMGCGSVDAARVRGLGRELLDLARMMPKDSAISMHMRAIAAEMVSTAADAMESGSVAQNDRYSIMEDKALRFDLDQAGIEQREAEAVELVTLRARVAEMERALVAKNTECRPVAKGFVSVADLRRLASDIEDQAMMSLSHREASGLRDAAGQIGILANSAQATEQESVAPTNLEISAIGASMHYLVRSGKVSDSVHDAVMRWLVAGRPERREDEQI